MKIVTEEFEELFKNYSFDMQDEESYMYEADPVVILKLYDPSSSQAWYVTRYNRDGKIAWGYITGSIEDNFAHFSVAELEEVYEYIEIEIVNKRLSECLK